MGFGIAIDDVGTRHSNLETVLSLRPHFIKISDVLVRGIARSTVKREMLRSLRHIAETIDAVMVAEGIEHFEDVVAIRDLGMRYGQGYYMARPGAAFPSLPDYVRAELRAVTPNTLPPVVVRVGAGGDDDDEDDERELSIPIDGRGDVPRHTWTQDEITSDFSLRDETRIKPRASQPPANPPASEQPPATAWQPLSDDEATGEALISSLKRPTREITQPIAQPIEKVPDGEPGPGRPGLN
jgi:hypothetical protein